MHGRMGSMRRGEGMGGIMRGMPSIARAAAGNDANPRLQPATSQTDNEHDASLRRRIPPLAAILPCHRHLVNHPTAFPAVGQGLPDRMTACRGWKNFSFPPAPATFPPALPVPKAGRESCGQQTRQKSLHATCGTSSPAASHHGNHQPVMPAQTPWHPAGAAPLSTLPAASGILAPPA